MIMSSTCARVSLTDSMDSPGFVLTVTCTIPSSTDDMRSTFSLEAKRKAAASSRTLVPMISLVLGMMEGMFLRYHACRDFIRRFTGAFSFSMGCHW